ncbi:MAG: PhzF family phenazine biosynthesis protein [Actinomycetota bacterium]|nr:PhzF family phenazine biosynthesis protein [Actinomycetota bacterium]
MTADGPLRYQVVDVFAERAFAGNPLAVVFDADGLSATQMQALAREFNLSETSFLHAPPPGADYGVRIFTPTVELPFAGHPSVGAAWALHSAGRLPAGQVVQSCGAGLLGVSVSGDGAVLTGGTPSVGAPLDPGPLLAAVGLSTQDLVGVAPRSCGAGIEFAFLLVHDDAVARADPDLAALRRLGGYGIAVSAFAHSRAHSRVFAGGAGVLEDPATGSAALGFGVFLAASGLLEEGRQSYVVEQGREMGRPSLLSCTVDVTDGRAVSGSVGGRVVAVAAGEIRRP